MKFINDNLEHLRLQAEGYRERAMNTVDELTKVKYNAYAKVCDREAD